ncbi:MAG: hypothetical protein Q9187_000810 [Circinaria calcarea]
MSNIKENHVQEQPETPLTIDTPSPPDPPPPSGISFYPRFTITYDQAARIAAEMAARVSTGSRPGSRFAQFKLVLLGESAVGKSSLVLRFVKDQFDDYRESTIGAAFLTQTLALDENTTVKFEIWDTAGQERYKSLAPMYYRNANCAVVVYDITQASSLDKAKSWVKELQRQANENIIIALAGNKLDLVTANPDKRAIPTADAEAYAREAELLFFETSAKTAENVREIFTGIARKLPIEQAGDAVAALNTLQSNFSVVDAIRKSGRGMNKQAIPEMIEWCSKIGYEPSDFNSLKPIHIAGTKGKGSTSAFISSILAQYLPSPSPSQSAPRVQKIGLYTSPHLRFVRERIQINNQPLSEALFAKYFFEVWDRLEASARAAGLPTDTSAKPVYFRFLTLMALHTYIGEKVDTAVIECGIGGEYDSTNIITQPTVTGITSLGIDHTAVLGSTIEEIAWHKAGIMKSSASAYTVPQPESAMKLLRQRAQEKGVDLRVVERHPQIENIKLGLAADFQKTNASLAIQIAAAHLRSLGHTDLITDPLPKEFIRGLENVRWGGRCETRHERDVTWYLDGGHTLESITVAGEWFASCCLPHSSSPSHLSSTSSSSSPCPPRILLFNQQTRTTAPELLKTLHALLSSALQTSHPFTHAIFCTNVTFSTGGYRPDLVSINTNRSDVEVLEVQKELARVWGEINASGCDERHRGTGQAIVLPTIEDAVRKCREIIGDAPGGEGEEKGKVLVTGSVHLVGGVLEVLETVGERGRG